MHERYVSEVRFRGPVEHRNSQYALFVAVCMWRGLRPDVFSDAGGGDPAVADAVYASLSTAGQRPNAWAFRSRRSPGGSPCSINLISRTTADRFDQHGEAA